MLRIPVVEYSIVKSLGVSWCLSSRKSCLIFTHTWLNSYSFSLLEQSSRRIPLRARETSPAYNSLSISLSAYSQAHDAGSLGKWQKCVLRDLLPSLLWLLSSSVLRPPHPTFPSQVLSTFSSLICSIECRCSRNFHSLLTCIEPYD